MILKPKYLAVALVAALCSCQSETAITVCDGPVIVGFSAGSAVKTAASEDGLSTSWTVGDKVALWAVDGSGNYTLNAQPFSTYSISGGFAFFTSTLASKMPEGTYTYFASHPVPDEVSAGKAVFTVPTKQDGKGGNGAELMFSSTTVAPEMKAINWRGTYDHSDFSLQMSPLLHRMRFYLMEEAGLEGELVEELKVTLPRPVAGKVALSLDNPFAGPEVQSGEQTITVLTDGPVPYSTSSERHYINVEMLPCSFTTGEYMDVTVHTASKIATAKVPLKSRTFAAGHSTPVRIIPTKIMDCPRLFFTLASNPIGEDLESVTITAPAGLTWGNSGSNVFTFSPKDPIKVGDTFYAEFYDFDQFITFGDKDFTVTFDSEHVRMTQTVHVGNLAGKPSENIALNLPWLLNEDFSTVESFSSNDKYGTSNAGSFSPHTFLNGWSGARAGAEAGKCVRLACRRETSARYDARIESAPLKCTFKKATNILLEFDWGANNQYGGIPISIFDGNVGQNCKVGYITTTDNYKSGKTDGTYQHDFYAKEYSGTFDNVPNKGSTFILNVPAGDVTRISWRTVVEEQAFTTNTTAWMYLDNIKVKISNQ